MGTDFLELFDRETAELIMKADEAQLAALVDSRANKQGLPVWNQYWLPVEGRFSDFEDGATPLQRLHTFIGQGSTMAEIKTDLLRNVCFGGKWVLLDYWGCWSEVFRSHDAQGSIAWETFIAPLGGQEDPECSGGYLLTDENLNQILSSLETHRHELTIMDKPQIERLRTWQSLCRQYPRFCVLYQMDF